MSVLNCLVTLIMLTLLELALCVDNLIFLTILVEKLPESNRARARYWGLSMAWITRLLLLAFAVFLTQLQTPLFVLHHIPVSINTMFLGFGGLFLIAKATQAIHKELEYFKGKPQRPSKKNNLFWSVIAQIAVMDVIFSLDSVLTAVGLTTIFWVMALAITISIIILMWLSGLIVRFINSYPTIKMLALCFLIFIGILMIADGLSYHVPRAYLYFAMTFSLLIEFLNNLRNHRKER